MLLDEMENSLLPIHVYPHLQKIIRRRRETFTLGTLGNRSESQLWKSCHVQSTARDQLHIRSNTHNIQNSVTATDALRPKPQMLGSMGDPLSAPHVGKWKRREWEA